MRQHEQKISIGKLIALAQYKIGDERRVCFQNPDTEHLFSLVKRPDGLITLEEQARFGWPKKDRLAGHMLPGKRDFLPVEPCSLGVDKHFLLLKLAELLALGLPIWQWDFLAKRLGNAVEEITALEFDRLVHRSF